MTVPDIAEIAIGQIDFLSSNEAYPARPRWNVQHTDIRHKSGTNVM